MFKLGQVVITRNALNVCNDNDIDAIAMIARHSVGDWGNLDKQDKQANSDAIKYGDRVLSKYVAKGHSFYVITESTREYTTILLTSEY